MCSVRSTHLGSVSRSRSGLRSWPRLPSSSGRSWHSSCLRSNRKSANGSCQPSLRVWGCSSSVRSSATSSSCHRRSNGSPIRHQGSRPSCPKQAGGSISSSSSRLASASASSCPLSCSTWSCSISSPTISCARAGDTSISACSYLRPWSRRMLRR